MRNAFYFVVDQKYFDLAVMQARRISSSFGYDVHIFLEFYPDDAAEKSVDVENVFVHYNRLARHLPEGLPSSSQWPPVVYLRIFAPLYLRGYERAIYLDADILVVASPEPILSLPMQGKALAAVQDMGLLRPNAPAFGLSTPEWLNKIGVRGNRYFSSGVLMIDVQRWIEIDFEERMRDYFAQYGTYVRMWDQDFLNWLLQDEWIELSPIWNFQVTIFNFGFEDFFRPAFIHFTDERKPWHGPGFDLDPRYVTLYRDLIAKAGIDPQALPGPRETPKPRPVNPFKRALRYLQALVGIRSRKERRVHASWCQLRDLYERTFTSCLATGAYADLRRQPFVPASIDVVFNGRIMIDRRSLGPSSIATSAPAARLQPVTSAAVGG